MAKSRKRKNSKVNYTQKIYDTREYLFSEDKYGTQHRRKNPTYKKWITINHPLPV